MPKHTCSLLVPAALCALLAGANGAAAQSADLGRVQRQLEQVRRDTRLRPDPEAPIGQRTLVEGGGYLSLNYLSVDDLNDNNRTLWQPDLVLYGRVNVDGVHDFFVRGRTGYEAFSAGDAFEGSDDGWFGPDLERAIYTFDLQRHRTVTSARATVPEDNVIVSGGRDLVYWANGVTLSQVLDGASAELSHGPLSMSLLVGMTVPDTVDFDTSRPEFDDETRRLFYGAQLSRQFGAHRPYVYVLNQRDHNDDSLVTFFNGVQATTQFDYDSYYIGVGSNGALSDRWSYGLEFVYEGGSTLSNSFEITPGGTLTPVSQQRDPIEAFAADARLDYLLTDARQTRVSLEFIAASGDTDRITSTNTFGGNRPGTPDHAFNSLGLLNTGLAFNPQVSNVMIARAGVATFPLRDVSTFRRLQVGVDVLLYNKLRTDAPIDEATDASRYLGWEPDLYATWRITSDVTLALRYGIFFPSGTILSSDEPRQFIFAGLTVAF